MIFRIEINQFITDLLGIQKKTSGFMVCSTQAWSLNTCSVSENDRLKFRFKAGSLIKTPTITLRDQYRFSRSLNAVNLTSAVSQMMFRWTFSVVCA